MATERELSIIIRMRDAATKQLRGLQRQLRGARTTFRDFSRSVAGGVLGVGAAGLSGMLMRSAIGFNMLRENAELAFETMLGSGEKAAGFLDDLERFAERTPFEFPDLLDASRRLMAMGWSAEQAIPTLEAIGNAVSAAGGSSELLDRITTAFGQIRTKGRLTSEEMMQLTEAGIPAWQMLAEEMGTSIPRAMRAVQRGRIPAEKALEMLERGIQKRFANLMERQSNTTAGAISNIKDIARFMLADVMRPVFLKLRDVLKGVAWTLVAIRTRMKSLPRPAKDLISTVGALTLILGPLLVGLGVVGNALAGLGTIAGLVAKAWPVLAAVLAPVAAALGVSVGGLLLLIGAVIAAVALLYLAWTNNWLGIRDWTAEAAQWIGDRLGELGGTFASVGQWISDRWQELGGTLGRVGDWVVQTFAWLTSEAGRIIGEGWTHVAAWFNWLTGEAGRIIGEGWSYVVAWFSWLTAEAGRIIGEGWTHVAAWFNWLTGEAGRIIGEGWSYVTAWFSWLTSEASRIVGEGWTHVTAWFGWLIGEASRIVGSGWTNVVDWFTWLDTSATGIVSDLTGWVAGAFQWMADRISDVWGTVSGIVERIKAAIGGIGSTFTGAIAPIAKALGIPGFASGGIVTRPTLAMVGEAGPEAIVPLGAGGFGSRTVVVQITGPVYGVDDLEDLVVDAIQRAERRGRL